MKKLTRFFVVAMLLCSHVVVNAQTEVIAHRGYWDKEGSAQNSLAALKHARELGIYGAEFDVWITADGIPVIFHDAAADGFSIEDSTYDALQAFRLPNGEKIPTLEQYLELGRLLPEIQLVLEIKPHQRVVNEDRLVALVLEQVNAAGLADRVDYISFSMNVCKELIRQAPDAPVAYLSGNVSPADLKALGFTGLDYHHQVLLIDHPEWIAEAKKLGLTTNVWTVNNPEMMQSLIEQGIDYITTDKPSELKELLGR